MKTILNTKWRIAALCLIICSLVLSLQSCSEDDDWQSDEVSLKALTVDGVAYHGPETFTTTSKEPLVIANTITNSNFKYLENFVIKVQNGTGKEKCQSIEVKIDGNVVVSSIDFRKNINPVMKPISGLTEESLLEVTIDGNKSGCFIELLIEGSLMEDVITDIDGNYYHTVQIGDQAWMAENLKTTKYNDGTTIRLGTDNSAFGGQFYFWYNDDPTTYKDTYGALYQWGVVSPLVNGGKNLCPTGWHVPTDAEWTVLTTYLGGESIAGGKMKEMGTTLWHSPNTGATNESGFTALPAGGRYKSSTEPETSYHNINEWTWFWTSRENYTDYAWLRVLVYTNNQCFRNDYFMGYAYSVRCVKD